MPGPLVHLGAVVQCLHAGQATPSTPNPRVTLSGQPAVAVTSPYVIAGCTLPPPTAANGPCVTGQFMTAATRVFADGQPLLLQDSQGLCTPTGQPLAVLAAQTRVTGI